MKEYVIQEDRGRLALYTGLFLILMILLMIASIAFFAVGWYLFSFLGITGLWFDVKAMFRYGNKLVRKKPVCEFGRDGLTIYYLPGKPREMKYRQVKEARSIRTRFTLKLFFGAIMWNIHQDGTMPVSSIRFRAKNWTRWKKTR